MIDFTAWNPQPSEKIKSLLTQRSIAQGDQRALLQALATWSDECSPYPDFNGKSIIGDPVLDINGLTSSQIKGAFSDWTSELSRDACLHEVGTGFFIGATWNQYYPTPFPEWHGIFMTFDAFHHHIASKGFISSLDQIQDD